MTQQRSKIKT